MYVCMHTIRIHVCVTDEWRMEDGGWHIARLLWYMCMLVSLVNSVESCGRVNTCGRTKVR